MLGFLICFSLVILIYLFYRMQLSNPYRVTLICGQKGSGKSTHAVSIALKHLNRKFLTWDKDIKRFVPHRWHVYTNMKMNIDGVVYIEHPEQLGQFSPKPYSVLILDEINTLPGWDNRDFKNMAKSTIQWMRYSRQYRVKCFFIVRPGTPTRRLNLSLTRFSLLEMYYLSLFSFARSKNA